MSLMKFWETNVSQVKSDLQYQYIVYIYHFIPEFTTNKTKGW